MPEDRKWTYYVAWDYPDGGDPDVEEFDIVATSEREAKKKLDEELARDYEPGGRVIRIVERFRGELYL